MKAITAAVIAILNVNIRFCPLAHCSAEAKRMELQRPSAFGGRPSVESLKGAKSELRAVRLAFEPADFGQIAALKAGSEIELRNIEPSLPRVTACWLFNFGRNTNDGPPTCLPWSPSRR